MNKHYLTLALLLSTCTATLIQSTDTQSSTPECTTFMDAATHKSCSCPDTGINGKCTAISGKSLTYYCDCSIKSVKKAPNKKQSLDNLSGSLDAEYKFIPTLADVLKQSIQQSGIYIFSQDINAPIYNLPMQRALVPLSRCTINECPWFFSFAPYGKTNQKQSIGNIHLENAEAGAFVQGGYYASNWFVNSIVALSGSKTKTHVDESVMIDKSHFTADALFALGLKTNQDDDSAWSANGEWFFGIASNRLDDNTAIFDVGNPSTGIQADVDWTFATFNNCKFELSAFSRFIHFFKKTIEFEKETFSYTPGSYIDVLLGLTQYYGSNYQHQFEIGYNPTVRIIKAEATNDQVNANMAAHLNDPESDKMRHTAYAIYSYNLVANSLPMTFSLGGSATVATHTNTYGTIFGTFGLSF